jgi:hypothetical protein
MPGQEGYEQAAERTANICIQVICQRWYIAEFHDRKMLEVVEHLLYN